MDTKVRAGAKGDKRAKSKEGAADAAKKKKFGFF